jgi:hypothetical protein
VLDPNPALNPSWSSRRSSGDLQLPNRAADVELINLLEAHAPREGEALATYEQLIEQSANPAVQYLGRLIIEDEKRHHDLLEEMLNGIKSFVWEVAIEPSMPSMPRQADPELLDKTRRLLALERRDATDLRRLRKSLRGTAKSSLLPLLLELMIHDTAKHIEILKFIKSRTAPR